MILSGFDHFSRERLKTTGVGKIKLLARGFSSKPRSCVVELRANIVKRRRDRIEHISA
jgi:hypothetical protein